MQTESTFYLFGLTIPKNEKHAILLANGRLNPNKNLQHYFQISPTRNYTIRDGKVETLFTLKDLLDFLVHFQPTASSIKENNTKYILDFKIDFQTEIKVEIHINFNSDEISIITNCVPPIYIKNSPKLPIIEQVSTSYRDKNFPLIAKVKYPYEVEEVSNSYLKINDEIAKIISRIFSHCFKINRLIDPLTKYFYTDIPQVKKILNNKKKKKKTKTFY